MTAIEAQEGKTRIDAALKAMRLFGLHREAADVSESVAALYAEMGKLYGLVEHGEVLYANSFQRRVETGRELQALKIRLDVYEAAVRELSEYLRRPLPARCSICIYRGGPCLGRGFDSGCAFEYCRLPEGGADG